MKILTAVILLVATNAIAADSPSIEIQATFYGFEPVSSAAVAPNPKDYRIGKRLFSRVDPNSGKLMSQLASPRVTTKSGQNAVIEIIRENKVPGQAKPIASGTTLDVTPTLQGNKINLTGKTIVRRLLKPGAKQPLGALSFATRETFFSGKIGNDKPLVINVDDGAEGQAQIILTARLITQFGTPVK